MDKTTALQKIGYSFKNDKLLDEALLAAGAPVSDAQVEGNEQGNKGLALIGDALIRLAIVDQGYVDGARTSSGFVMDRGSNISLEMDAHKLDLGRFVQPETSRNLAIDNPNREYKKTTLAHGENRRPRFNEVRFVRSRVQDAAPLASVGIAKLLGQMVQVGYSIVIKDIAAMASSPFDSFRSSLKDYFNADTFSDATVLCNGKEFKAHKLILSAQSEFFSKAFAGDWKESDSGKIDLEEVDVNVVEAMLHFMYHFDYNNIHGASTMIFNAQVYSLADKYIIPTLKAQAKEKFKTAISTGWAMDDFPLAIAEVYNSTPESDRDLRDLTVEIARTNINPLRENELFRDALRDIPAFAAEMVISISATHMKAQKTYKFRLIDLGPAAFDPLRLGGIVDRTEEEVGYGTGVRRDIPAESDLVSFVGSGDNPEELPETLHVVTSLCTSVCKAVSFRVLSESLVGPKYHWLFARWHSDAGLLSRPPVVYPDLVEAGPGGGQGNEGGRQDGPIHSENMVRESEIEVN
ncbi:hypothetical protein DL768_005799 [Monosporascus sp. mg162]|nr:hypothetical protein DL768_005799 [Monosporascus sp. mg162]